ncbi:MAG: hypothetical protein LBE91_03530 [Tannerella sp.]|jgi:hypothetical protein|nr:hypothetical protein [Tannerella sp.]
MRDKIISFLRTKNIEIPDNENEIINLFLGASIVGKIDYWLERSFDFIDNEKPKTPFEREWSEVAKEDKAYRTNFAQLDNEAKTQLKKLLQETIEGVMFSTLSELNENWSICLDTNNMKGNANENRELNTDLWKWIDLFGQNE